jgi:NAD(P)H dehydrogenase (quinone)
MIASRENQPLGRWPVAWLRLSDSGSLHPCRSGVGRIVCPQRPRRLARGTDVGDDVRVERGWARTGEMSGRVGNTDAGGELGRRVAERLAELGVEQRLISLDHAAAPELPGAEVVEVGGYGEFDAMRAALVGVETLFLVPIREHPERAALHRAAVDAALAAGVRRMVYSSFLAAAADATFTLARDHFATEQRIRSSGLPFTFLRGGAFHDVLRYVIGDDGVIRGPAGFGRFAPLALDDLAETVVAMLTSDGAHDGATFDVTGPALLSFEDVADVFAAASGRPVSYVEETLEQARASRRAYGAADWQVDAWVTTYLQIALGELEVVSDTVPLLTGHQALSLEGFLTAHPEHYEYL